MFSSRVAPSTDQLLLDELARLGERLPDVIRIPADFTGSARYRLIGGVLAPDWAASHERYLERERAVGRISEEARPYCEITVWLDSEVLGSYGGTVWPCAWPDLFEAHKGSAQSGSSTVVKPLAKLLLSQAKAECPR